MKKIIAAVLLASICVTPVYANHDRDYVYHDHRNRGGVSAGGAVAIGIGAIILGAVIADSRRDDRPVIVQQRPYYPQHQQVCETIESRDYYGNLLNRRTVCYYPR